MTISILTIFGLFLVIDLLWLGVVARNFYKRQLGELLAERVRWVPALIFYVIYAFGLYVFVVSAGEGLVFSEALGRGALFGAVAYATYDLSNYATLKQWPIAVVFADIIWGAVISGVVSSIVVMWL